ncbi:MAG: hypothetical protein RR691_08550 [Eubacterium sp.]
MVNWNYDAKQYEEAKAGVPAGDHRVRIFEASEEKSKKGYDMIKVTLDVSGHAMPLYYYMVFLPQYPQMTNGNLGKIYDSFGIQPGDLNLSHWSGKVGAARVKHELYEGEPQPRVSYFLAKGKQANLKPWAEPARAENKTTDDGLNDPDFNLISEDDDVPF